MIEIRPYDWVQYQGRLHKVRALCDQCGGECWLAWRIDHRGRPSPGLVHLPRDQFVFVRSG